MRLWNEKKNLKKYQKIRRLRQSAERNLHCCLEEFPLVEKCLVFLYIWDMKNYIIVLSRKILIRRWSFMEKMFKVKDKETLMKGWKEE